jgi:hypothetical protein
MLCFYYNGIFIISQYAYGSAIIKNVLYTEFNNSFIRLGYNKRNSI